jgi:hypothetical protein
MESPEMKIFMHFIVLVSAALALPGCAGTGGQAAETPQTGDVGTEPTFEGYGFRVLVGSGVEVREESPVEDFVLYTFTRQGVNLLHAYSGNHPQFPASLEHSSPERHMAIHGLSARCFDGEKDGTFSRECLILLEETTLPHYVHVWYGSLAHEDRERADAIISSMMPTR